MTVASPTEENYLKALFAISNMDGEVNMSDLSAYLQVSKPTANSMAKNLQKQNLVIYEKYRPLKLTESGKRAAALVIRKHRLTEMFLVERMGFGWEEVHHIAEQVEHIQSPRFFEKMDDLLGHPKLDPHGSPIPDENGNMVWKEYLKLSDCNQGERVRLVAVINTSDDFLRFLNSREIHLGLEVEIVAIEVFDRSIMIRYGNRQPETFSTMVTERLLVEKVDTR